MTEKEASALKEFLLDVSCLDALDNWKDEVNIFDILKVTNTEIRHSNFLAWLLNPNENHGLGDAFIKGFVTKILQNTPEHLCNPFELLLQDFFSYQVYRESNHMDIKLISKEEKTAIIIENKVWSGESSHQLETYEAQSRIDHPDCEHFLYVFLTPYGIDASAPERWVSLSYEDVISALENAVQDKQLVPEVALVVNNYIKAVKGNIMKEKDQLLVKICNDIYNKHRTALRLIYENVNIDKSADSEIICETLKKLADEGKTVFAGNNSLSFFTKEMNEFLPPLKEANSSWNSNWVYYYWFEISGEHLAIHFELGGQNTTPEHDLHMRALIKAAGKKKFDFTYQRLYFQKKEISQSNYEESLRNAVITLVEAALKQEKEWLEKANAFLD